MLTQGCGSVKKGLFHLLKWNKPFLSLMHFRKGIYTENVYCKQLPYYAVLIVSFRHCPRLAQWSGGRLFLPCKIIYDFTLCFQTPCFVPKVCEANRRTKSGSAWVQFENRLLFIWKERGNVYDRCSDHFDIDTVNNNLHKEITALSAT